MRADSFAGVWSLVSFSARDDTSGEVLLPYGEHPTGCLIYTTTGYMSATLGRADRPPFAAPDRRGSTDAEVRAAFETFDAYTGTYEIDAAASRVVHHVLQSSWPNVTRTDQVRHFQFSGEELTLTTPPTLARGKKWVLTLKWRRLA